MLVKALISLSIVLNKLDELWMPKHLLWDIFIRKERWNHFGDVIICESLM